MNYEVKKVFSQKPMISFRSARKLSSHLVWAKLYRIERTVGSFKCTTKHFEVCKNVNRTYTLLKEQLDHLDVPKSVQSEMLISLTVLPPRLLKIHIKSGINLIVTISA